MDESFKEFIKEFDNLMEVIDQKLALIDRGIVELSESIKLIRNSLKETD